VGKSRIANLSAILVVGAMSVPLLASCSSTSSGTSSGTAKQLAELKGSDTVASDEFGVSVASRARTPSWALRAPRIPGGRTSSTSRRRLETGS